MPIDETRELLVYIRDVPALLPPRSNGKPITTATVRNWIRTGVAGIRLEATDVGGLLVVSREALSRWRAAVTEARSRPKQKATTEAASDSGPADPVESAPPIAAAVRADHKQWKIFMLRIPLFSRY